jgi:hypothetical protein
MAIYRALAQTIVSEEEYRERIADGSIDRFAELAKRADRSATLDLDNGRVTLESLQASPSDGKAAFTPVGPGKPLNVMIRHVYTGRHPKQGIFGRSKDLLLVSAMKSLGTYEAAPRALNFLETEVKPASNFAYGSAMSSGTPLVFYAPALTDTDSVVTFEMTFDEFPKDSIEKVVSTLQALGGIPIFVPHAGILLAAGMLTKLLGRLGEALFDGAPVFRATDPITFTQPGEPIAVADYRLIVDSGNFDSRLLRTHEVRNGKLVANDGSGDYQGEHPYLVISLDGAEHKKYENFMPTAATAAILERFYRSQRSSSASMEVLVDAIRLYSDVSFRRRAEALKLEIDKLGKGPKRDEKVKAYNAIAKNILNAELRLEPIDD